MKSLADTRTVSVIIVTRDRAAVLPACLDSIASQCPPPDEIILVVGSEQSFTDTLRVRYADLPISVYPCPEPNICKARNIGVQHARSDVLIFIDDDAQAHSNLIAAYTEAFMHDQQAWAAGGAVWDTRFNPPREEFVSGLIRPSGVQIAVHDPDRTGVPRGFVRSVKGCNFAIHRTRIPQDLRFDPFFAFAFDETDLIMRIHHRGGGVIHVPAAVVDHTHAPGAYRAQSPLDRDWRTEFASHTRFMRKHTRGTARLWGWCVVVRRLLKHILRANWAMIRAQLGPKAAVRCMTQAVAGIRYAARSHDTARSSR